MERQTLRLTLSVALTAALGACADPSRPIDPVGTPNVAVVRNLTCRRPVPDREITIPIAPPSSRVDLVTPVFANSTNVVNPLFPIANLHQAILVGSEGGEPLRVETTLLAATRLIDLGDRKVRTLTSQFVSYVDRRIHEIALDWYAQADDGAVWYFGEDVFNYEDGELADTDGTWIACKDGPAAMIMPGNPKVGDVYRPENAFPIVFEEVTVKAVGQTVRGPLGPVSGAITVQELHMDGGLEDKTFAPGYGEFSTGSGADLEALAVAIPADAAGGPTPADLRTIVTGARSVFTAAGSGDWTGATASVAAMNAAWSRYQGPAVPRLIAPLMSDALSDLTQSVGARQAANSRQFALDVSQHGIDLELRYRTRVDMDFARLELWSRQLNVDAQASDEAGVASDLTILRAILDRLADAGTVRDRALAGRVRGQLPSLRAAKERGDFAAVLAGALRLQGMLSERV